MSYPGVRVRLILIENVFGNNVWRSKWPLKWKTLRQTVKWARNQIIKSSDCTVSGESNANGGGGKGSTQRFVYKTLTETLSMSWSAFCLAAICSMVHATLTLAGPLVETSFGKRKKIADNYGNYVNLGLFFNILLVLCIVRYSLPLAIAEMQVHWFKSAQMFLTLQPLFMYAI